MISEKPGNTRVGKAHRVEHASGQLGDTHGGVAKTWFTRNRLGRNGTKVLKVEHFT
jgi:hypothetical protein